MEVSAIRPLLEPLNGARHAGRRRLGLLVVFLGAAVVTLTGIGVPDPRGDEAVTSLVVHRPWSGILPLLAERDAPLVPYYILVKAIVSAEEGIPTLIALRVVSALAAAGAVAALYSLVVRRAGLLAAFLSATVLLSLPAFTRWAQDARPYALMALMGTLSWLAWDTWRRPAPRAERSGPRDRRTTWRTVLGFGGYAAALAGSAVFHLFGVFNWPAQLVADLTTPKLRWAERLRRALWSGAAMAAALLAVGYPVWLAATRGTGPDRVKVINAERLWTTYVSSITEAVNPLPALPVMILAGLALVSLIIPHPTCRRHRPLTRIAAIWFAVPMALNLAILLPASQLMSPRYWSPNLIPFSVLAAVGILIVAEFGYLVTSRALAARPRALRQRWGLVSAGALVLGLVLLLIAVGLPQQAAVRGERGHGTQVDQAIARVDSLIAEDPSLVVLVTAASYPAIIQARAPQFRELDPLNWVDKHSPMPWPRRRSMDKLKVRLETAQTVAWINGKGPLTSGAERITLALAEAGFERMSRESMGTVWLEVYQR